MHETSPRSRHLTLDPVLVGHMCLRVGRASAREIRGYCVVEPPVRLPPQRHATGEMTGDGVEVTVTVRRGHGAQINLTPWGAVACVNTAVPPTGTTTAEYAWEPGAGADDPIFGGALLVHEALHDLVEWMCRCLDGRSGARRETCSPALR